MNNTKTDVGRTLVKICRDLETLSRKVESIIEMQKRSKKSSARFLVQENAVALDSLDAMTLLSLPDHLRKTAVAICKLGRSTAHDIAGETDRARAVESNYLNQLVMMGLLKRERQGRKVYFQVER